MLDRSYWESPENHVKNRWKRYFDAQTKAKTVLIELQNWTLTKKTQYDCIVITSYMYDQKLTIFSNGDMVHTMQCDSLFQ